MNEEDIEHAPRRRSARIIALGEKRERQKKELEEARKNCTDHQYKRKGKAVINAEQVHGFIDDEDDEEDNDEYARTKKRGRKSRPLNQLISLTQPIQDGQYTEYSSASRRYGFPRMLPKDTLEFVLDHLQRKLDPDGIFAQPVNPNQDYHRIVKEPMDFGTMRTKVHENMYTNMAQFQRDLYLMCTNAMSVNPSSTASYKVAETIKDEASKLFHALSADPEFFDMGYFGPDWKKSRGRKGHARSKSSGRPRQLPSKPRGGNSGANNSMRAEVDKRQTYCPSGGDSIFSQVLDRPKTNLLPHKSSRHYQDSLVRFTEDLGPAVKKCAARKIESLRQGQIMGGQATRPNALANFLEPTSTLPPHAPHSRHYTVSSNRPLTIPGFTPHEETRNNINFGDYKGKKVAVDPKENWNAHAASILSGYFMNNNGGGRERGLNFNGEGSSSNSNKPSSFHQNRSSFLTVSPSNQNQNQNQGMHRPQTSNARNNLVNTGRNHVAPREFTQLGPRVRPSIVIPGQTQPRPNAQPIIHRPAARRPMLSDHSLSSHQNPMRPEQEPTLVGLNNNNNLNLSEHSRWPQNLTELDLSRLRHALWSQQIPSEQVTTGNNFTSHPFMPDQNNKPAMFLNKENNNLAPSWKSFILPQQQNPQKAVNMSSYNFSAGQQPLLSSQQSRANSNPMNGYDNNPLSGNGQSVVSQQPGPEDLGLITGLQSFPPQSDFVTCQSFMPQQNGLMAQAVTGFNDNNLSHVAKWSEEGASNLSNNMGNTLNQPDEFQTIWAPIDLNNIPLTDIYSAPPVLFDNSGNLLIQPEPEPDPAQLNPLGLFPRKIPTPVVPPSASLEMPVGLNAMNYYMGNATVGQPLVGGGGEGTSTAQLQWNNDHHPNLALQL